MPRYTCLVQDISNRSGIPKRILKAYMRLPGNGVNGQKPKTLDPAQLERILAHDPKAVISECFPDKTCPLRRNSVRGQIEHQVADRFRRLIGVNDSLQLRLRNAFNTEQFLGVLIQDLKRFQAESGDNGSGCFWSDSFDQAAAQVCDHVFLIRRYKLMHTRNSQLQAIFGTLPGAVQFHFNSISRRQVHANCGKVDLAVGIVTIRPGCSRYRFVQRVVGEHAIPGC